MVVVVVIIRCVYICMRVCVRVCVCVCVCVRVLVRVFVWVEQTFAGTRWMISFILSGIGLLRSEGSFKTHICGGFLLGARASATRWS